MRLWIAECETCGRTIEMPASSVPFDLTIGSHGALSADGTTILIDSRCPGSHQPARWIEEQPEQPAQPAGSTS